MLHRQAINAWLTRFDHKLNIKYFHVECVVVCAETNCCVTKTLSLPNLPFIGMFFLLFSFPSFCLHVIQLTMCSFARFNSPHLNYTF